MRQEQDNKPRDRKFAPTSSKNTVLENQVISSGSLHSNMLSDFIV